MYSKKFLIYGSYIKNDKEILVDFQITAYSRSEAKGKAMERMAADGGTNRYIDGIHLMDKEFKRREASFSADGRRSRAGEDNADKT